MPMTGINRPHADVFVENVLCDALELNVKGDCIVETQMFLAFFSVFSKTNAYGGSFCEEAAQPLHVPVDLKLG